MMKMELERLQKIYESGEVKEGFYYQVKGMEEKRWFRDIEFKYGHIDGVKFENVNFRHCTFYKCDFSKVHFKNCDFSFCKFMFSTIDDCSFEDCNLDSIRFYYSNTNEALKFRHCMINGMELNKAYAYFALIDSTLLQYSVFNASFSILSEGITSIEDGDIIKSSFDIFIDKHECKIIDLSIDFSTVTISGIGGLTKDTMIIKNIVIRKSTVSTKLYIDSKSILNYIYCPDCSINYKPYNKYTYPVNVGPIGSRGEFTTYYPDRDVVSCGCWKTDNEDIPTGTLEEFETRVNEWYGENAKFPNKFYYSQYMNAIAYFKMERYRYLESLNKSKGDKVKQSLC